MRNASARSLRGNLIFNLIYQVVVVVAPLIITPKFSRIMGPDYVGLRSFTFTIVYYFAVIGTLGLDMYGQRVVAQVKDDQLQRSKLFFTIALLRFCLCAISTLIYVFSFIVFNQDPLMKVLYLAWLIYLIREMINPVWYLQAVEKFKLVSVLNILSQIAYVLAVFFFINTKEDLALYIVFFTAIPLAIAIFFWPFVLSDVKICRINIKNFPTILKESFIYFIPTIATAIYSMVDKTMLGLFDATQVSTGYYEQAEKLVKVALAFSTASFTIMRTRMSYVFKNSTEKSYKSYCDTFISFSMALCWPIMFGIIGISQDFVPLFFGDGYDAVTGLCWVFALVIPCLTISGLLQALYIFPQGLQKKMNIYYFIVLSVNVGLNSCLIPFFQAYGAVAASLVAELLLAVILLIKARKSIDIKQFFIKSIKYIFASLVMLVIMFILGKFLQVTAIYKVLIEFVCGVLAYYVTCMILRDNFVVTQTKKVFKILLKK